MPKTTTVESPGCPPLRVLTTDSLGLIKVVEARESAVGATVMPKLVETWGTTDVSQGILVASLADRKNDPVLAVGRKNGLINFLNPLNGNALASISIREAGSAASTSVDDPLAALHIFKSESPGYSKLGNVLTCTRKGKACLRSVWNKDVPSELRDDLLKEWSVCNSGEVLCSSVDASEKFALFGGKGMEISLWDVTGSSKIWTAKSPAPNKLGLRDPSWFTAATFLCNDDHRKIVAGTQSHQIRLYDSSSQRRPVTSIEFRESTITAISKDLNGYAIYVGTGCGDLARFDMRTGKLLGCFVGKCSGSIKSIARHPNLPILASCGLDRFLRIWDVENRQLLSAVFLKQHLSNLAFDSHFTGEDSNGQKIEESTPNSMKELPELDAREAEEAVDLPLTEDATIEAIDDEVDTAERIHTKRSTRRPLKSRSGGKHEAEKARTSKKRMEQGIDEEGSSLSLSKKKKRREKKMMAIAEV